MKRRYEVRVYDHGFNRITPVPEMVTSNSNIRAVLPALFYRVFGRRPDRYCQAGSGHGYAKDRRGNTMFLEQINDNHYPGFDPRTGRFPLVPVQQAA